MIITCLTTKIEEEQLPVNNKDDLLQQIENLKLELIDLSNKKGMVHPETIRISQKLDQLLNQVQSQNYHSNIG
ncbi:aspartyl-phosphate phosphatase Spo0E family protein [Bacillaceae bacterium IKA-2]|nr:aspartyl-phosphate phosphatase Spo0E family protein [Bacillaceae bacterium IKA-2]